MLQSTWHYSQWPVFAFMLLSVAPWLNTKLSPLWFQYVTWQFSNKKCHVRPKINLYHILMWHKLKCMPHFKVSKRSWGNWLLEPDCDKSGDFWKARGHVVLLKAPQYFVIKQLIQKSSQKRKKNPELFH